MLINVKNMNITKNIWRLRFRTELVIDIYLFILQGYFPHLEPMKSEARTQTFEKEGGGAKLRVLQRGV